MSRTSRQLNNGWEFVGHQDVSGRITRTRWHLTEETTGEQSIHRLLFYCYAKGIFSSRKMERATYELIPVWHLTAGTHPNHDSINTFRKRFWLPT